jgi:hypothetical protein
VGNQPEIAEPSHDETQIAADKYFAQRQWAVLKSEIIGQRSDRGSGLKIGDQVKLIGIPPDVHDCRELQARRLFEKCLGESFTVAGLETVEGLPYQLVKLDVGGALGIAPYLETIWVEPEHLELEASR